MSALTEKFCTAILLVACCNMAARAQEEDDRWYQVELLIFTHEDTTTGEQWEATPDLAYPDAARFLVFPELVAARQEEHGGISEVDEFGRQFLRPVIEEDDVDTTGETDIPLRQPTPVVDPNTPPEPEPPVETDVLPPRPTPFIALPHTARELRGKAAYMQRTGLYRVLFHETWVQPILDETRALPLIIDNSGDLGDWPLLQGSIKLHIARYLHIETNLWLNTRGEYLSGGWRMPPPPLGPVSVIIEEPEPDPYFGAWPELEEPLAEISASPADVEQMPPDPNSIAVPDPNSIAIEEIEPIYPYRHAVLLQQKRRMRSNELHYLDHPLLGVVVKLAPLDDEQLAALAAAEQPDAGEEAQPEENQLP